MTNVKSRKRTPAGVSSGGEFAIEPKQDPNIDLASWQKQVASPKSVPELDQAMSDALDAWDDDRTQEASDTLDRASLEAFSGTIRDTYPDATHVDIDWSDQGDFLAPGAVRSHDGTVIGYAQDVETPGGNNPDSILSNIAGFDARSVLMGEAADGRPTAPRAAPLIEIDQWLQAHKA
ncbi:hypothetical protein V5R04_06745 [Jonesiaceae bacterium BS-20]|uniref:Uncharacterized protein n=1 Tax=Jonesiaceae bacterium BS-20 TaxID=3120821 RepID=A0AAU7E185_9MICO